MFLGKRVATWFLVLGSLLGAGTALQAALPQEVEGEQLPSLAPMLEQVTPAVVNISTEGRIKLQMNPLLSDPFFRRFFNVPDQPIERKTQSLGSGVIVDAERGLVLTNHHVVANAIQITVTMRDGRHLDAKLIGTDPETDVAVLRVPPENLVGIEVADSDALRVGDFVVAIGNPFGLGQTVTSGIVSALSRSGLGIEGYEDFIQTDASINPGNSGGALVNLRGELVGINTAIFSQSGGNIGIGFAIPINLAIQITEQLVETGQVERGFIGLQVQDLSPELADAFGIQRQSGAVVNSVMPESPAAEADLRPGDVVVAINGRPVRNAGDVRNHIGLLPVGEDIEFEFLRQGKRLAARATVAAGRSAATGASVRNPRLAGVSVAEIPPDHPHRNRVRGVLVADIASDSRAWQAGLREGDIITSVNHQRFASVEELLAVVDQFRGSLLLHVIRGNAAAYLVIN